MAQYKKDYLFDRNIDWFGKINDRWVYAASRGGLLPGIVNDDEFLPKLQGVASNLPEIFKEEEIEVNDDLISLRYQRAIQIISERVELNDAGLEKLRDEYTLAEFRSNFIDLFISMARKGFYSFIRLDIDDPFSNIYRMVAYPKLGSPQLMDEILRSPLHTSLMDKDYQTYIDNLNVGNGLEELTFQSDLNRFFM